MNEFKPIEFKPNEIHIRLIVANIVLAFCVSFLNFLTKKISLGSGWFLVGSVWCLNYFLRAHTPFCRITKDELIFPAILNKFTKRINWTSLERIDSVKKNKLVFIINGQKNIKIDLRGINKDERISFIESINEIFSTKKQNR